MNPHEANPELESFREKWRAEVRARNTASTGSQQQQQASVGTSHATISQAIPSIPPRPAHLGTSKPTVLETDDDFVQARVYGDIEPQPAARQPERKAADLVTALDHYEHAVEKEAQGSLGDSLRLYRKAFRMDHKVDQKYKNKHHAAAWAKPAQASRPDPSPAGRDAPQPPPENRSSKEGQSPGEAKALTADELVASFAGLAVEPARPPIKGMPRPPCPIAELPEEIFIHILQELAAEDVGDFVRLSRVCKRFAWLVATEDSIWRRACLGPKFGFTGMHYEFRTSVNWKALAEERTLLDDDPAGTARLREEEAHATTVALLNTTYRSWQRMFRRRPRVRFNGCYISTINYIRAGQQTNSLAWNSPVHIVTYYRYLRLFRDGTAITLCTVEEPASVVHHITREALALHRGGAMAHLPSSAMQHALRARWRLGSAEDLAEEGAGKEVGNLADTEGNLFIESDGGGNYLYRMELALRTAGRHSSNNKLAWRGFYSYNKSAEVWDEFTLKDIKPFFFSRVKSYGFSELEGSQ